MAKYKYKQGSDTRVSTDSVDIEELLSNGRVVSGEYSCSSHIHAVEIGVAGSNHYSIESIS